MCSHFNLNPINVSPKCFFYVRTPNPQIPNSWSDAAHTRNMGISTKCLEFIAFVYDIGAEIESDA